MIWYPLHVRSQREMATAQDLRADGIDVFVATQRVFRMCRNSKGSLTKREKLIVAAPGYVFASEPWGIVNTAWGKRQRHRDVIGTLMMDGEPCAIPDRQMIGLKTLAMREPEDEITFKPLSPGQIVRLSGTAYDAFPVTISRMVGKKVEVVVQLFGGERRTTVQREAIAA